MRRHEAGAAMIALLGGALSAVGPAAAAAPLEERGPVGVMTSIYRDDIAAGKPDWLGAQERSRHLSRSLLALWAKADAKRPPAGDAGPIDFDLTADTNGLVLNGFKVALDRRSARAATVAVALRYQKPYVRHGQAIVTYVLVRESGRWRVDDIRTPQWSVRHLLSDWLTGGSP